MDKLVCRDYCYKFVTLLTQIWSLGVKQNPLHKLSNIVTSGAGSRGVRMHGAPGPLYFWWTILQCLHFLHLCLRPATVSPHLYIYGALTLRGSMQRHV